MTPADSTPAAAAAADSLGPAAAAPRRARRWRWWLVLPLATVVLLLAAVASLGWLAWRHEAALPWLLQHVPGLSVTGVKGTLAGDRLQIDTLDLQMPVDIGRLKASGLVVDGLAIRLWPRPGAQAALHIRALQVDRLQFISGAPSGQPMTAPADLHLPLDLQIDRLAITELRIDAQPPVQQLQTALTLGGDSGRTHRLSGARLTLDVGSTEQPAPLQVQADLQIGTDAPLPLLATLAVQQAPTPVPAGATRAGGAAGWQAELHASGPLSRLDTDLRLTGAPPAAQPGKAAAAGPSLRARATLLPFAAWPLAALQLQTEALDMAALSPQWPTTRLGGSADVQSSGLDRPATVQATITNAAPGPWDAGRLPLQRLRLQASGAPRQWDRLTLDNFELQFGDAAGAAGAAGRITGKGLWLADTLALDLKLDNLQPARLHRRAAALALAGPLQLRASGLPAPQPDTGSPPKAAASAPQVAIDAQLSGRLIDGSGVPVQLKFKGDASARHLRLVQADALAGPAQASATLDVRAVPAGWQVRGHLALADFDPRPWWRGAEQSAWRRGPHRLGATLDADLLWQHAATRLLAADTLAFDRLLAAVDGDAALTVRNSLLAGVPVSGEFKLHSVGPSASVDGSARLAGNQLTLAGTGGGAPTADQWQLKLDAPALSALAPLADMVNELAPGAAAAWPRAGAVTAALTTSGRWPAMRTQGELRTQGFVADLGTLQSGTLDWRTGGDVDAPLNLKLQAQGLVLGGAGGQRVDRLQADISGSPRDHSIRLLADSPARPPAWSESLLGPAGTGTRFESESRGQWTMPGKAAAGGYQVRGMTLKAGARDALGGSRPWLSAQGLGGVLVLDAAGQVESLRADPGRVQLLSAALNWRDLRWARGVTSGGPGRLDVVAELETIEVARLLTQLQPDIGWGGKLTVGGRIEVHAAARFDAEIVLERGGGDLTVTDDLGVTQGLGLSDLRLAMTAHDGLWQVAQGLAGRRIGTIAGAQVIRSTPDRRWPAADSALQGVLEARVADLGLWGAWVPPGWRLAGRLDTTAQFGGTLGASEIKGSMAGTDLGVRNLLQGVNLTDGQLAISLNGAEARIERLSFKGGEGRLDVTGGASLGAQPRATLRVVADKFRALGRVDRRVVASGSAELKLDAERLQLDGAITVDEGLIDIGRAEAPSLDSDVVISRAPPAGATTEPRTDPSTNASTNPSSNPGSDPPATVATPQPAPVRNAQVNVKVSLGQQLRLRGKGVDTLLRGDLALTSPGGRLALNGTVRTQDGQFAAYGQKLDITRGDFSFSGAIDNPRLDVLAVRPNLDVVVGVTAIGYASNPRIRLYSEPDMADYEKLSWLLTGHASDGLGSADAAVLQQAAFALLAGDGSGATNQALNLLGSADFSLKQTEGDTRDTIIGVGKQLSRNWYVGYERGVHATTGTWQVIYRVAQRFTVRAQSGDDTALDVIWTWRW